MFHGWGFKSPLRHHKTPGQRPGVCLYAIGLKGLLSPMVTRWSHFCGWTRDRFARFKLLAVAASWPSKARGAVPGRPLVRSPRRPAPRVIHSRRSTGAPLIRTGLEP